MSDDAVMRMYYRRLATAREQLGGACSGCGATEALQFDHIDPTTKVGDVTSMAIYRADRFWAEVVKCQLLCRECHRIKSRGDRQPPHGSSRRYAKPWSCRCELCREGSRRRRREQRARARADDPTFRPHGARVTLG